MSISVSSAVERPQKGADIYVGGEITTLPWEGSITANEELSDAVVTDDSIVLGNSEDVRGAHTVESPSPDEMSGLWFVWTKYIGFVVCFLLLLLLVAIVWFRQLKVGFAKTTAELIERQKQLRLATTFANIGIWDWDVVNDVLIWDEQTKLIYGINNVDGENGIELWKNALVDAERDVAWKKLQCVLHGGDGYLAVFQILNPKTGLRFIKAYGQVIRDQSGAPVRMLGVNYDITERKVVEETLRKDEARLRNILQTAMDGFLVVAREGHILEVNSAYCNMIGYEYDELLSMHIKDVIDEGYHEEALAHVKLIVENGRDRFESRHRCKDGSVIDVEVSVIFDPADGGHFINFVHDITERKRTEELLRKRLVALTKPLNSPDGITFEDIFELDEIQRLQDQFAAATGVASIITRVDGVPITKPSNFCRLCNDLIRNCPKGRANCYKSDAALGKLNKDGPTIQPCLSGGLWDAGAAISVGGRHLANWLIGQVRDETQTDEKMRAYAREIGINEDEVVEAFHEVPAMSHEQFKLVAQALYSFANQLSDSAYQNVQQARFISEKQQAEDALRNNEEKCRIIYNAPTEAIIIHDACTGKMLEVNDAALKMYGFSTKEEFLSSNFDNICAYDLGYNAERALTLIHEAAGGVEKKFDWKCRRKDGSSFQVEVVLTAGKINGEKCVLAVIRDSTEVKNAEEALRKSEEKFSTVIQSTPSAMCFYTLEDSGQLVLTGATPAADRVLGRSHDALIGKTFEETFPPVEGVDLSGLYRQVALGETGSKAFEVTYDDVMLSGIFYVHVFATMEKQIAVDLVDISKRKKSEEMQIILNKALENLTDAVGMSTADGHHYYQNKAFENLFGKIGECPSKEIYVDETLGRRIFQTLMSGDDWSGEIEMYDRHHNIRNIFLRAYASKDENGKIISLVGVHTDITERKQIEERLRHVEKMDAIGKLAGGVAHDFNNQLGGIMGLAELLLRHLQDPVLRGYASSIITTTSRASDITSKLLAFARKGQYQYIVVDMHSVIHEVVDILSHSIDKKISIKKHLLASPSTTKGDPSQLQNALLNLAINARDAMPEGGVLTFETCIDQLDADYCSNMSYDIYPGGYLRIDVTDTGSGIPKENIAKIYEPFFTTKDIGKGTGMGLAAVYGTIKQHSGAINVYSELGLGTVFKIFLPLEAEERVSEYEPVEIVHALRPAKILLIDDEEIIRSVAEDILTGLGYQAVHCANGRLGIDYYREHWQDIDLVILDMVMPEMNGPETYNEMTRINPQVRVLISSGYSIDGAAKAMIDSGVCGFIQKPYRRNQLASKVAEVLG